MRTPSNPAIRKAAKGAVMAGTALISAIAVGMLVKRRLNASENSASGTSAPAISDAESSAPDPLPRKEAE